MAAPVRVVRAAPAVEQGDLRGICGVHLPELGELQRGFNAMVNGLRERERVRDLSAATSDAKAAAAERERPQPGGEDRHAAVVSSTSLWLQRLGGQPTCRPRGQALNRVFATSSTRPTVTTD